MDSPPHSAPDASSEGGPSSDFLNEQPPQLPAGEPAVSPEVDASVPFVFHGTAREYFRIWIVNTLLSLLTCGIFFAWAKVRKRRYLRGSTELLGNRFDYRADPVRLLIGNLIVALFFLGYGIFGAVYPPVRYGTIALIILCLPWIVVRSLAFNAHNTVYRGMRFRYKPSLAGAVGVYLLQPVVIVLTLGIYYPAWVRARQKFAVENHRLGDAFFRFDPPGSNFYAAYLLGGLILGGITAIGAFYLFGLRFGLKITRPDLLQMLPYFALSGLGLFIGRHFIFASLFNHLWNHTHLDDHRFIASMKVDRWLGLQLSNLGAIVLSCGLLYPWAVIRTLKYKASCIRFQPAGPLEKIEYLAVSRGNALGDTAAEFVGLDFGL
jgi:uncharacterized membrane protein YjgN (DUF898 family)